MLHKKKNTQMCIRDRMEIVPNEYIRDVRVTPDLDNSLVRMRIRVSSASSTENASPAHIRPMAADQTDSQETVLAFSPDRQNSSNVICKVYPCLLYTSSLLYFCFPYLKTAPGIFPGAVFLIRFRHICPSLLLLIQIFCYPLYFCKSFSSSSEIFFASSYLPA